MVILVGTPSAYCTSWARQFYLTWCDRLVWYGKCILHTPRHGILSHISGEPGRLAYLLHIALLGPALDELAHIARQCGIDLRAALASDARRGERTARPWRAIEARRGERTANDARRGKRGKRATIEPRRKARNAKRATRFGRKFSHRFAKHFSHLADRPSVFA